MSKILIVAKIVCLLSASVALLWIAYSFAVFSGSATSAVRTIGDQAVKTLDRAATSLDQAATSLDRVSTSTTKAADDVTPQARLAIMSWRGISFDLRRNWTANVNFQTAIQEKMSESFDRAGKALERAADSLDRVSVSVAARVDEAGREASSLLADSRQAVKVAENELGAISNTMQSNITLATASGTRVMDQAQASIKLADPIIEDAGRISESAAKISEYYEKKWTRGSKWDKFKLILQTVFSAFNLVMYH